MPVLSAGKGTCGGTANGAECMFPFEHDGVVYEGCSTVDHDQPWCMTDLHGNWGNCICDLPGMLPQRRPMTSLKWLRAQHPPVLSRTMRKAPLGVHAARYSGWNTAGA